MKTNKILLSLLLLMVSLSAWAGPIEEGKVLFTSRCAGCHNINQQLTGPALAGVDQRRSIEWIISFVKSPRGMVNNGDKDAVALFEKYRTPMPDHADLTDENIRQIVEYIKSETKPAGENKGPFAKPSRRSDSSRPLTQKDIGVFGVYLLAVGVLIAVLLWGVEVKSFQQKKMQAHES